MYKSIGFIGLGLIGGSIARALRECCPNSRIIAYSRKTLLAGDIAEALHANVIDDAVFSLQALSECDIVFLCAPVDANLTYIEKLSEILKPDALLTDVGSVKSAICERAAEFGLSARFIGGHPMTGSERTGFTSSSALLLENAFYALTVPADFPKERLDRFVALVNEMKAIPVVLDPTVHDGAVSAISHVPHLIAAQLVNLVRTAPDSDVCQTLAAGGFKDITRIASSSPTLWEGILSSNKAFVLPTLDRYIRLLQEARDALSSDRTDEIAADFYEAGRFRSSLGDHKGVLPESFLLYADIKDEAGAIATFANLLASNGISLKNIGIVHNREFERGVLRMEFYDKKSRSAATEVFSRAGFSYTL